MDPVGPGRPAIVFNMRPMMQGSRIDCTHNASNPPQIEPDLLPGESLESGVRRVTQLLITYFEQYFLRFPEQWRYLRHLPLYFVEDKAGSELA